MRLSLAQIWDRHDAKRIPVRQALWFIDGPSGTRVEATIEKTNYLSAAVTLFINIKTGYPSLERKKERKMEQ